jgi:hypothetical protein
LIPKQLRMEWTDLLVLDADLSRGALKVGLVIGTFLNKHRGDTHVSQATIAEICRFTIKGVQKAIGELEARGYLVVRRHDLGTRRDGRRVCGGRGTANTYAPALDGMQVTATTAGRRLAERVKEAQERTNRSSSSELAQDEPGFVLSHRKGRTETPSKDEPGFVPTLTDPSDQNPTRAREARAGPPGNGARSRRQNTLGSAGVVLEEMLGMVDFQNWFGQVRVVRIEGELLTLAAPGKFVREQILQRFRQQILAAWRRAGISVQQLDIEVRP